VRGIESTENLTLREDTEIRRVILLWEAEAKAAVGMESEGA
jgi:hypothetical protein